MAKTGPTPDPNAPQGVVRRRVDSPLLADVVVALPISAEPQWGPSTVRAYRAYAESHAARVLREEDVLEVVTLFGMVDQRTRYVTQLTGDPTLDLKALQAIKIIDSMVDRKASSLGIGPLARTRLGIAKLEQASKLKDLEVTDDDTDF
jgi:hypothetical protein